MQTNREAFMEFTRGGSPSPQPQGVGCMSYYNGQDGCLEVALATLGFILCIALLALLVTHPGFIQFTLSLLMGIAIWLGNKN
jgi:hypothetical protein